MALKIVEQTPVEERLKGLELFSLEVRRLMRGSVVGVYKVIKAVARVNMNLLSPNATPLEAEPLKDVCRRFNRECVVKKTMHIDQ